jgi:hypothetical protein
MTSSTALAVGSYLSSNIGYDQANVRQPFQPDQSTLRSATFNVLDYSARQRGDTVGSAETSIDNPPTDMARPSGAIEGTCDSTEILHSISSPDGVRYGAHRLQQGCGQWNAGEF